MGRDRTLHVTSSEADGFRHLLKHFGPATRAWTANMNADAFD